MVKESKKTTPQKICLQAVAYLKVGEGSDLCVPRGRRSPRGRQNKYLKMKNLGFLRSKIVKLLSQIGGNSIYITNLFTVYTPCFLLWAAIVITRTGRQNAQLRHCLQGQIQLMSPGARLLVKLTAIDLRFRISDKIFLVIMQTAVLLCSKQRVWIRFRPFLFMVAFINVWPSPEQVVNRQFLCT